MILFEASSGWYGHSYQRLYIWAENLEQAKVLAKSKIQEAFGTPPVDDWHFKELMTESTPSFATEVSTDGWETKS